MTQTGSIKQPPEQLFRQAVDAVTSPEDRTVFGYTGPCGEAMLTATALDVKRAVSDLPRQMQKHLFASFIELFQNIGRYGICADDAPSGPASGEIIITAGTTGGYNIHAANLITEHARIMLADRLAELLISAG